MPFNGCCRAFYPVSPFLSSPARACTIPEMPPCSSHPIAPPFQKMIPLAPTNAPALVAIWRVHVLFYIPMYAYTLVPALQRVELCRLFRFDAARAFRFLFSSLWDVLSPLSPSRDGSLYEMWGGKTGHWEGQNGNSFTCWNYDCRCKSTLSVSTPFGFCTRPQPTADVWLWIFP